MWFIIATLIVTLAIYFKFIRPLNYWKDKQVRYIKPWPIFGNLAANVFRRRAFTHLLQDAYNTYPEERYIGFYNFSTPILLLRDPDLIKQITIKDFDVFPEHRPFIPEDVDPLWNKNLFAMKGGENWRNLRSILSPSFTGSKMRIMFNLMKECSNQFSQHFLKQRGIVTVELKDAFTRFTNDVIATAAFGVTCDSLEQPKNEFYTMGKDLINQDGLKSLKFIIFLLSPALTKLINLQMFSEVVKSFFINLVKNTIKIREENNVYRPDMIHLLMQARKGQLNYDKDFEKPDLEFAVVQESELNNVNVTAEKEKLTDVDITAQVLIFFFAGFDTSSTMMCYASYELAFNPEIQEKLYTEIAESLKKTNGEFTYDSIINMRYLDMVVSETLRKWPPFAGIDRRCVRPYVIKAKNSNEVDLKLDVHSTCIIPLSAIQRDPKYYPNPDKFDPERFNEQNKHKILPFTYLPFGSGPRNCIGSRFALLEGKLILAEIVSKFEILPVTKTQIPIVISKSNFNPIPDDGFWLGLKARNVL